MISLIKSMKNWVGNLILSEIIKSDNYKEEILLLANLTIISKKDFQV